MSLLVDASAVGPVASAGTGPTADPASAPAPPDASWRSACVTALWAWVGGHLVMFVASAVAKLSLFQDGGPVLDRLVRAWAWGDTPQFLSLAVHGYSGNEQTAFFPAYPVLIRLLDPVLPGGGFVAAVVISSVCSYAAFVLLHRLAAHELGSGAAGRAVFYLAAYPLAHFLYIGYNTSLFLVLALGALYAMRRQSWWVAGALSGLASATRSAGVILAAVLLFEYLRRRGFRWRAVRWDVLSVGLAGWGLAAFSLYCWISFGDPRRFSHAQAYWGRSFEPPWEGMRQVIVHLGDHPALHPATIYNLVDLLSAVFMLVLLALCVVGPWRLRRDQYYLVLYGALTMLVALSFPTSQGLPMLSNARFMIEMVPAFLLLARLGGNPHVERLYLMPALGMQAIWMTLILNGTLGG